MADIDWLAKMGPLAYTGKFERAEAEAAAWLLTWVNLTRASWGPLKFADVRSHLFTSVGDDKNVEWRSEHVKTWMLNPFVRPLAGIDMLAQQGRILLSEDRKVVTFTEAFREECLEVLCG